MDKRNKSEHHSFEQHRLTVPHNQMNPEQLPAELHRWILFNLITKNLSLPAVVGREFHCEVSLLFLLLIDPTGSQKLRNANGVSRIIAAVDPHILFRREAEKVVAFFSSG
jgi:hypothetical protein